MQLVKRRDGRVTEGISRFAGESIVVINLERCPSGWRSTLGKRVCEKSYRGFESPSLRHVPHGTWLRQLRKTFQLKLLAVTKFFCIFLVLAKIIASKLCWTLKNYLKKNLYHNEGCFLRLIFKLEKNNKLKTWLKIKELNSKGHRLSKNPKIYNFRHHKPWCLFGIPLVKGSKLKLQT